MNLDFIAEQGNKYELASGINNVKQDVTAETREFLEIQMEAEDNRDKAKFSKRMLTSSMRWGVSSLTS